MRLEEHFESSSALQRNERVKLAATFWNNVGAGMVIGGMAAAFFLDKPPGIWTKIGIAIAGFVLGWLCYSIASNLLTYLHTAHRSAPLGAAGGTAGQLRELAKPKECLTIGVSARN
jgi:F0F1-type ATP synthase assembly protein I